jgi:polyhydroxybutyrate depolymerase
MKSINLFIAFLFISLNSTAQLVDESFVFDGVQRNHKVYVPTNFSENMPLVLNLHGYTSNAFQQVFYSNMNAVAEQNDFMVVFPDGTTDQNGITFWNSEILGESVNDLGYLEALIDSMILNYNIDPNRVYMCGMSNGGFMSYYSACELSTIIAAIASVTGVMNNAIYDNCNPERAVPVLEIHGTADATVPYNGASSSGSFQTMIPIEEVVDFWVNHNNCTLESEQELENISTSDLSTVTHFKYTGGDNGSSVEHYRINEGGHTWPGSIIPLPGVVTNQDIIASEVIWDFFNRYDLDGLLAVDEVLVEASFTLSPNPMSVSSILKSSSKIQMLTIYNLQGKRLFNTAVNDFEYTLEKGFLGSGMYIIELVADGSRICQPLLVQ